ncbi:hypothetical protein [Ramlibacter humi]|uniref:Uncharacterized protein n=1 Tax=Ramlibacter humi TaxID=2530451 RepID=A0A4Z0CBW4_9BURK|nr:hypothetical protein [Ramlibacter humi]TFZ07928.1 hypothetical protein EZ216_01825 [Ramlibacter humi]
MHTAICTFEDRANAERARDRLLRAGFAAEDVHLQHRGARDSDAMGEDPRAWSGTDREVAADRNMVDRVAGFFVHLFGADAANDRENYTRRVDSGRTVLVVDTHSETEADRARALLHDLQADDVNVYARGADSRPVRDLVADMPVHVDSPERIQAAFHGRSTDWTDRSADTRERAVAAGTPGEQRPLDLRDPDLDHVGLRYENLDKDKTPR